MLLSSLLLTGLLHTAVLMRRDCPLRALVSIIQSDVKPVPSRGDIYACNAAASRHVVIYTVPDSISTAHIRVLHPAQVGPAAIGTRPTHERYLRMTGRVASTGSGTRYTLPSSLN